MQGFLTQQQLDEIDRIKELFREGSEFTSYVVARSITVTQNSFNPYQNGTIVYYDRIIKARLVHQDNFNRRVDVAGNIDDAYFRLTVNKDDEAIVKSADEIILNHSFSDTYVNVPANIDSDSVTDIENYKSENIFIDYTQDGLIGGDKTVLSGKRILYPNEFETIFFLKLKEEASA